MSYSKEEIERNLDKAYKYFDNIEKAFAFYYWRARRYQGYVLISITILAILTLSLCYLWSLYVAYFTVIPISLLVYMYYRYGKTRRHYAHWSFKKYKNIREDGINFNTRL
jgi:hypothetical protein